TVDRHLVQTVANTHDVPRSQPGRDTLLWAALFHDIGKVAGATDHSLEGVRRAAPLLERIGLGEDERRDVLLLVEHHLLLAEVATSEDPNDPAVVARVAQTLHDRADLVTLLRQLTEADARAAGPKAWTAWRARLVDILTDNVLRYLRGWRRDAPATLLPRASGRGSRRVAGLRRDRRGIPEGEAPLRRFPSRCSWCLVQRGQRRRVRAEAGTGRSVTRADGAAGRPTERTRTSAADGGRTARCRPRRGRRSPCPRPGGRRARRPTRPVSSPGRCPSAAQLS